MATERRRHPRTKKRLAVRFGPGDLAHVGYTDDVSDRGLHLRSAVIYPPHTVLVLQIDYPEKPLSTRGVVRWSKNLPPAFKRSMRGAMGIEFSGSVGEAADKAKSQPATASPAARPAPARGPVPDASEAELGGGSTNRRQVSTGGGNTYEVLLTEYRGAFYARLFQLPRSMGSAEAVFRAAFWKREDADAAVKKFLKEH